MKINCIILDDEPENLKYLQQIIEDIDGVQIVKSFTDAESFTEGIKGLQFDMCILDNKLPVSSGVELAKKLRNKKIIFVSAHDISAYDAFEVGAVDVLKKPVTNEKLESAVKKCRDRIINEKGFVFLKTSEGKTRFLLDDIVYIESEKEAPANKIITTKNGDKIKTVKMNFEYLQNKLPSDRFCPVNKSVLLNSSYIKTFGKSNNVYLNFKEPPKKGETSFISGDKFIKDLKKAVGYEDDTD